MAYDIGFVGLGVMGRPMAGFILDRQSREGGRLVVHERNRQIAEDLLARGAVWSDTPAGLAACDLIVFMVPDMPIIMGLVDGSDGILASVQRPVTLVVSSTCTPQEVRDLDILAAERTSGLARVVDAPVSGGAEGAESGTLSIMVGGDDALVGPVLDVLSAAGQPVHLGPVGAGQVAKACNQLVVAAEVVALAEASLLAERAGLDVKVMFETLQRGYAGSRVLEVKAHRFVNHDHSPSGPARFMIKDLRAVAEEAEQSGLALVSVDALRRVFTELTEAGLGDYDTAVVQRFIESRSKPQPAGDASA